MDKLLDYKSIPEFKGYVLGDVEFLCLSDILQYTLPLWKDLPLVVQGTEYALAQIHTIAVKADLDYKRVTRKRDSIMNRLRDEEAQRLGCSVSDLYCYYPHSKVDEEYSIRPEYFVSPCDKDIDVLRSNHKVAFGKSSEMTNGDIYRIDVMLNYLTELRSNMFRRTLKV